MELILNKITITGFKGYKGTTEYDLGYRTLVTGNNGLGKSSIGEAIAWAITGCDIWGNEKSSTRLVNDNKPKVTEVILDFNLDGEQQSIIRRKKGSSNEVYWNDKKSSTNELSEKLFKLKDVFLSILNPYYFPELTPKTAKQLLSDVLKPVSKDDIFTELGDYLKDILINNGFRIPETFISDARADIKEQEENITYLEGVIDGLKENEVEEKKEFNDTDLDNAKDELKKLKANCNVDEAIAKLEKPRDITNELKSLDIDEKMAKAELDNLTLQELVDTTLMKERKTDLLREYHFKKDKLDNMKHEIIKCDKCGNEIDLTKKIAENLQDELEQIVEKGKALSEKIKKVEVSNKAISESNNVIKAKKEKEVAERLQSIEAERAAIVFENDKKVKEYEEKIKAITEDSNSAEIKDKIQFLTNKVEQLEEEKQSIIRHNAQIDVAIKNNANLVKDKELNLEKIQNSKNKISQLKLAIDAAKQYNSIKIKKQSEQIKPYLKDVEIQFEELNKDGELKDKFKICYQKKDFNKLSNAEKIKAGLEIANLLINICDMHFPIFLDNAESITKIPEVKTQMIIAKVTENNEITVEVQE